MTLTLHLERLALLAVNLMGIWRGWRLPAKLAIGASVLVLAGMAHVGVIVTGHIHDSVLRNSASAAALYMDSFVARHVQELATNSTLSEENRHALEQLLSPASIHRPVIAFRVWKGDAVVFSNERDIIGQRFASTPARERALSGEIGAEFEQAGHDDDEQVRSLNVPVLEVYAPVRQTGTGRIIAVVEIYEIGVELKTTLWVRQLSAWGAILAVTLTVIGLLFSMAGTGRIERNSLLGQIRHLARLRAESERRRQKIGQANLQVFAMNERSLHSVGNELHRGPGQHLALALLKFDALEQLAAKADLAAPRRANENRADLDAIRNALKEALQHIRSVSGSFPPAAIENLTVADTFAKAITRHEQRTGAAVPFHSSGLPDDASFALKSSLYRFTLQCLDSTYPARAQSVSAVCDHDALTLEISGGRETLDAETHIVTGDCPRLKNLQDRIEAIGGKLTRVQKPCGDVSLIAELSLFDMEVASD
jgi:signal transduction histidine kinase